MDILHEPPTSSQFTLLTDHQSQTPSSFFSGPAILHHHSPAATLSLHTDELASAPALSNLASRAEKPINGTSTRVNGDETRGGEEEHEEVEVRGVDVWVTSERLILYSPSLSTGLSIPYPTISLHAIQSQPPSLFLQLLTSAQTFDDHDPDSTVSLTIIPTAGAGSAATLPSSDVTAAAAAAAEEENVDSTTTPHPATQQPSPIQTLYTALSACAALHPDPLSASPSDDDDDSFVPHHASPTFLTSSAVDEAIYPLSTAHISSSTPTSTTQNQTQTPALPPPLPGSSGWITAENVGEFFDEEGNWRGGEEWTESEMLGRPGGGLGEGAGRVRGREEDGGDEGEGEEGGGGDAGVNGGAGEGEETKWRRTE